MLESVSARHLDCQAFLARAGRGRSDRPSSRVITVITLSGGQHANQQVKLPVILPGTTNGALFASIRIVGRLTGKKKRRPEGEA